jgi:hypothetical protein
VIAVGDAGRREFGGVGTRMLFENDLVRIWEMSLMPGEGSPLHRHDLDHVLVQVLGDRVAAEPEPDTQGPYTEYLEADIVRGQSAFIERGGIETARNVGDRPYYEIIVEFKD